MKRLGVSLLALAVLFTGLAIGSQAQAFGKYGQGALTGKWNLSQVSSGRTQAGSVEFSKTGKLTKWVLIGVTQGAVSGRLTVSLDGKVTGVLTRSLVDNNRGVTYHMQFAFNLQFQSASKVTGSVLLTLTERNNATGSMTGRVQRIPAQWTLTRLVRVMPTRTAK